MSAHTEATVNIPLNSQPKWFTTILLHYQDQKGFWDRDAGLFCEGFRRIGLDSKLVALGDPGIHIDRPLVTGSLKQLSDPAWWGKWNLDGVVLYSWALPKFEPVARAIKASGAKLLINLDTDGVRSPRVWFSRYLHIKYIYSRMEGRLLPWLMAVAKTLAALPTAYHAGTIRHLEHADIIAIQSPLAKQRFSRFLISCGRQDLLSRVFLLHHPVSVNMSYDPAIQKRPVIIAVGRWDVLVKDTPLLVRVLGKALANEQEYTVRIVGSGEAEARRLVSRLPQSISSRITVTGPISHDQLHQQYQESQIIINSSYSEGFNLSVAEALCCGCSVVGTAYMSGMNYCCGFASGTMACNRSANHYRDALCAEMEAWRSGDRDPAHISQFWTQRLHVDRVARSILDCAAHLQKKVPLNPASAT